MSERSSEAGEPTDLFGYINSQGFTTASSDDIAVNESSESASDEAVQESSSENNVAATSETSEPEGVTAAAPADDDEKIQLRQQIQEANERQAQITQALTAFAAQARQREQDLFESKLALLTPEEADAERQQRETGRLQSENAYLKSIQQASQDKAASAQESIDKASVAHKVVERLGLPAGDTYVMQALMESQSPTEMFAAAKRLSALYKTADQAEAKATATAAASNGVHAASGEAAPAAPAKPVPQRSGNLIDMMQERKYVNAAQ